MKAKKPRVVDEHLLRAYASLPSLTNLRWIFLAHLETLKENERLKATPCPHCGHKTKVQT